MADFSKPNLDSEIVSNLSDIRSNVDASVVMLKGIAPTGANFPIDAVLFDQGRFQRWNGSQFNDALIGISGGGTGASTAVGARQNIGADNAENLTQGILPAARLIGEYNIDISGTADVAASLNTASDAFYRNASNLNAGTVPDERLSDNVIKASDLIFRAGLCSAIIKNSFPSPSSDTIGLTFDGSNLISCDFASDTIYVHNGVSSTILTSFPSPSVNIRGLTFDGSNLISCDASSDTIYVHNGVSSAILTSFPSPSTFPSALAFDGSNLISFDGSSDTIYVHNGVSSAILTSFPGPSVDISGLAFDGSNLISCTAASDTIYVHNGVSSTILTSFPSPSVAPSGITFDGSNLISCDASSDTIYVHRSEIYF